MKTVCFVNPRLPKIVVALTDLPNSVCIANTATIAADMLQVVNFSRLLQVAASLLLHQAGASDANIS